MPSQDVIVAQEDFSAGMVRDVAPHLIPDTGVYDAVNGMIGDDDGSIFWRGGNEDYSASAFGSAGLRHLWTGHLGPGERVLTADSSDFYTMNGTTPVTLGSDGLSYPTSCAEIAGLLFIGGGYIWGGSLKAAPYTTGTISVTQGSKTVTGSGTTWNTLVDAGMLMQIGNGRVYVIESIDSTTQVTLRDAYEGSTAAGQAYSFHNIYKITTADPYNASDSYTVSTSRLLWHDARNVYFTSLRTTAPQENPHVTAANDYHTVPAGARVTGLATIGQIVLIFTTGGVYRLGGLAYNIVDEAGNPQHSFELLSSDYVLAGVAGIAGWEQYLVVPCVDGIHLIDGTSSPTRISKNIDPLYQEYIKLGYRIGGAAVYKNRYLLPIIGGAGGIKDVLVCRLDRAARDRRRKVTFPWTHLTDSGAAMASYAVKNPTTPTTPTLLGAEWGTRAKITDCSGYLKPSASNKTDADGTTPSFGIVFRDFETGGLTLNVVKWARLGYELIADTGDNPYLILDYSIGVRKPGSAAWGDPAGLWGTGFGPSGTSPWLPGTEGEFAPVMRGPTRDTAPPTELDPHRFRINKRFRHARFWLRGENDPAESCVIRRLELQIRPSQAVRK